MRKNYYNDNINMINYRELNYALNSSKDIEDKELIFELINKINKYTSMKVLDFDIAILDINYNDKLRRLLNIMKSNFFNTQEYISESDYKLANNYAKEFLDERLLYKFDKIYDYNITGFKKDIINCCRDEEDTTKIIDFVITIKQLKGNMNLDRSVYLYDGEEISLKNAQDPELIGITIPYDKLTKIVLNDTGQICVYLDINGRVIETEYLSLLKKYDNEELYPGEILGIDAVSLKKYLDKKVMYDDTELVEYINKENVKKYELK